ncbi:hypothetical protein KI688_011455 [Linnemannia hyalina]|uniref:AMP-activated protein kinase glycogen-binding domain-containing protein n=1 Tax=Linnemannia hyalina TaxID=64524 RepID=A0A9P7XVD9_9FUNG|nr:hypothetical protein KI688_011455 [Linnemannia hyalina]
MAFRKPAPSYDPRPGKDTSAASKDISSNSLAFLTHSVPSRHRSGSTASTRSTNSEQQQKATSTTITNNNPLNPTLANNSSNSNNALLLPRNSSDNSSTHSKQSHHHIRLPSFFRRRKHSSASATTESPSSHSPSPSSSTAQLSLQQHTIVMVPTHDIHIKWPHPVPSGNAFIAGTWSVPGHGPWEKLPMTRIDGTDSFEIHLDVQEIEDISDYFDEDGYLHHELLDHHHPHDQSHQGSPPLAPTSTTSSTTTHISRRKRFSRFLGRARSSSSASATSTTSTNNKDLHIDLPYHHQSKDGTYLPLAREYRYQYKFVIDDEWKCDHDQAQVQDSHGHWNHELAVELVEQPSAGSGGGRSRSSSLQSQHGPQVSEQVSINKPLPTPHPTIITTSSSDSTTTTTTTTSIIVSPAEEDEKDLAREVIENIDVGSAPVSASPTTVTAAAPVAADVDAAIPTLTTTRMGNNVKSRDTYEAVLIFDETDDLSDGEGGRSKRQQVVESDDEDEELEDNNINNNIATEEKEIVLLGEDEDVVKAEVTPQQDDHASLSPADPQQDNYPSEETSPVVIKLSAANTADDTTANPVSPSIEVAEVSSDKVIEIEVAQQAVEEKKEVEQDASAAAIEDVFMNSPSVAEPLPQLGESPIIIPAESSSSTVEEEHESSTAAAVEEVAVPAPIVEAKVAEPLVVETEKVAVVERALEVEETPAPAPTVSSPAPTSVAIPASPNFSFESIAAQSHLLSPDVEPETFVLQAAVNLDEENTGKDNDGVNEVEELEPDVKPAASAPPAPVPTKVVLEVVTDASAIAVATAAAAAAASATSTANDYPQVPSPPLTPSNLSSSKRDLLTDQIISVESTETEGEKQQQQNEESFERSVYMTPRAETTMTKHSTVEETTTVEEPSTVAAAAVEDENATIDILEDKDLPASLLSNSSSSLSLSTLNGGQSSSRRSSNSSTSTKASSSSPPYREMVEHDKSKKNGPEQHPSLFWSICKTTAVVSTAVVILGLGLGRKRD